MSPSKSFLSAGRLALSLLLFVVGFFALFAGISELTEGETTNGLVLVVCSAIALRVAILKGAEALRGRARQPRLLDAVFFLVAFGFFGALEVVKVVQADERSHALLNALAAAFIFSGLAYVAYGWRRARSRRTL